MLSIPSIGFASASYELLLQRRYGFQFPLLGSKVHNIHNYIGHCLSIPSIGFVKPLRIMLLTSLFPFNSLYWVQLRHPVYEAMNRLHFQFPLLGSHSYASTKLHDRELFQFPLLGSYFIFCCLAVARCYFQFPLLGS